MTAVKASAAHRPIPAVANVGQNPTTDLSAQMELLTSHFAKTDYLFGQPWAALLSWGRTPAERIEQTLRHLADLVAKKEFDPKAVATFLICTRPDCISAFKAWLDRTEIQSPNFFVRLGNRIFREESPDPRQECAAQLDSLVRDFSNGKGDIVLRMRAVAAAIDCSSIPSSCGEYGSRYFARYTRAAVSGDSCGEIAIHGADWTDWSQSNPKEESFSDLRVTHRILKKFHALGIITDRISVTEEDFVKQFGGTEGQAARMGAYSMVAASFRAASQLYGIDNPLDLSRTLIELQPLPDDSLGDRVAKVSRLLKCYPGFAKGVFEELGIEGVEVLELLHRGEQLSLPWNEKRNELVGTQGVPRFVDELHERLHARLVEDQTNVLKQIISDDGKVRGIKFADIEREAYLKVTIDPSAISGDAFSIAMKHVKQHQASNIGS